MPINGLTGFGGGNGGILSGGVPDPTFSISANTTSVNEGSSVTFTITTTHFPNATNLYWNINQVSGTVNSSDFSNGITSDYWTVYNNQPFNLVIGIKNDVTTESGSDIFNVQIRTGSNSGPIVATSANVTINDTSITPSEALYHTAGTYSFVAPAAAASSGVCAVVVGGGGAGDTSGGGGGGLAFKNNIPVSNGGSYTIVVGQGGPYSSTPRTGLQSYAFSTGEVRAAGGSGASGTSPGPGGSWQAGNGGSSGGSGSPGPAWGGGGGGASGYSGTGGNAGNQQGSSGSGGGGGGGGSNGPSDPPGLSIRKGGAGGGVSLYGQGPNGYGAPYHYIGGYGGGGGSYVDLSPYGIPPAQSGGVNGSNGGVHWGGPGGRFGGGGGGANSTGWGGNGAPGGVRIIWGPGRSFPNSNAGYI